MSKRQIEIRRRILSANEKAACDLRQALAETATLSINLISSPGSGKTTLLEATIQRLKSRYRIGALEGDIATERDAQRLRDAGIPARQILTGGACHLDARQVRNELRGAQFPPLHFLFIENVGNLICPTSYDLGEDFKVVLLSVVEGDDKPFKYPAIFSQAAVTVLTKTDLLPHVDFDLSTVRTQVLILNPAARIFETSCKTGAGISDWCRFLEETHRAKSKVESVQT